MIPLAVTGVESSRAQPLTQDIFADLSSNCVRENVSPADSLTLVVANDYPVIDLAVISALDSLVDRLYIINSLTGTAKTARVSYQPTSLDVEYSKHSANKLTRDVGVTIDYQYVDEDGLVVSAGECSKSFTDIVHRRDIQSIETQSFPATIAVVPKRSWLRRNAEVVVVTATAGLSAFLLFSLRSTDN